MTFRALSNPNPNQYTSMSHRHHHSDHICLSPKFPMILTANHTTRSSITRFSGTKKRVFTSHTSLARKKPLNGGLISGRSSAANIFNTFSISESKDMFPEWLSERKDFQKEIYKMNNLDCIDIGFICERPNMLREDIEKRALRE